MKKERLYKKAGEKIPLEKYKEKIRFLYYEKGLSLKDVANEIGVCTSTIRKNMIEWNMPRKWKQREIIKPPKEKLNELYLDKKLTMEKIAELLKVSQTPVYKWLHEYNIPIRKFKYKKYFYDFLAGFFDSDGCLHLYNNHGYIGLTALIYNSNKKLLEIIKKRLERDEFHPNFSRFFKKGEKTTNNYYRGNNLWAIRLHTNKEVLSLMNLMPIKHREKFDRLKIAMAVNKSNRWKEISNQINNLRITIKKEVKKYIKPKINNIKNERSFII